VRYDAEVNAICWPRHVRGPPEKGRYSQLVYMSEDGNIQWKKRLLPGSQMLPPLRSKFICVLTVDVFSAMHGVWEMQYAGSFLDKNRGLPIRAAAERKDGIYYCHSRIHRYYWIQALYYSKISS
jgi:hypothetical protein